MTILRNKASLIITLSVPVSSGTQAAKDVRAAIGKTARVTWLTDAPGSLLERGTVQANDEIGLLTAADNRGDLAAAVRNAVRQLREDRRELSTVDDGGGKVWDHADLLAKGGCSSVLQYHLEQSKGWLKKSADTSADEPSRGRFGLWIVPVTRKLSTRKDVAIAHRQLEADLTKGLAHWAVSVSSDREMCHGLAEISGSIDKLAARNKITLATVQEFTAARAKELRSPAAVSILRKAA